VWAATLTERTRKARAGVWLAWSVHGHLGFETRGIAGDMIARRIDANNSANRCPYAATHKSNLVLAGLHLSENSEWDCKNVPVLGAPANRREHSLQVYLPGKSTSG
jgi:hypothetical protein